MTTALAEPEISSATTTVLILASQSPRRLELLRAAGFDPTVRTTTVDDGVLSSGRVCPEAWTLALAHLKARAVFETLATPERDDAVLLAADTMVEHEGTLLGKPRTATDARDMIRRVRNARHRVLTGVCILTSAGEHQFLDCANVHVGDLDNDTIDRYIDSGGWRGKAGGYNLSERQDAGWPIECTGDPTTVMGLPMRLLEPELTEALRVHAERASD